jgi:L-seryl-tRNA(Ser) seleniumtransferase
MHRLLATPPLPELAARLGRAVVAAAADEELADRRVAGRPGALAEIAAAVARRAEALARPSLRRVINATGVVLHTNLGRAPLPEAAVSAVAAVARGYSNLEYDLEQGERGSRHVHAAALLRRLTGAADALVVNNNAAAVLLVLAAVAAGREVVVSRGELVEIGGSFRIPDVMAQSGARLREVGTTNRTHAADYRAAIGPETAALLKAHPSNYRVVGFTAEVGLAELAAIARDAGLPLLYDLGSGTLLDLRPFGLAGEPTVAEALAQGADIVTFSGDKLLGGPQAGVICGRADLVARCRRHPLARAVRPDKLTLAALEATLRLYLDPERARTEVPVLAMLARTPQELAEAAAELAARLARACGATAAVEVAADASRAGGGSLPLAELPTHVVRLRPTPAAAVADAAALAARLRAGTPPVVARIQDDALLLDPRTLRPGEADELAAAVAAALAAPAGRAPGFDGE